MSLLKSALLANSLEDAVQLAKARTLQSGLLGRLGMIGVGLAGLGGAARGAQSLYGLYRRNIKKPRKPVPAPVSVQVPYPAGPEDEMKTAGLKQLAMQLFAPGKFQQLGRVQGRLAQQVAGARGPLNKLLGQTGAGQVQSNLGRFPMDITATRSGGAAVTPGVGMDAFKAIAAAKQRMTQLARTSGNSGMLTQLGASPEGAGLPTFGKASGLATPAGLGSEFMRGDLATSESGIPWMMPAAIMTGLGGLYGGWKAADKLLDARRKSELKGELDKAKTEYEAALLSEYPQTKISSDEPAMNAELDRLYNEFEKLEKKAGFVDSMMDPMTYTDGAGKLTGTYLTMAGLGTAGTAIAVYNAIKKRQESELLRKAQKNRERRLFESQPSPLYAESVPTRAG